MIHDWGQEANAIRAQQQQNVPIPVPHITQEQTIAINLMCAEWAISYENVRDLMRKLGGYYQDLVQLDPRTLDDETVQDFMATCQIFCAENTIESSVAAMIQCMLVYGKISMPVNRIITDTEQNNTEEFDQTQGQNAFATKVTTFEFGHSPILRVDLSDDGWLDRTTDLEVSTQKVLIFIKAVRSGHPLLNIMTKLVNCNSTVFDYLATEHITLEITATLPTNRAVINAPVDRANVAGFLLPSINMANVAKQGESRKINES